MTQEILELENELDMRWLEGNVIISFNREEILGEAA